MLKEVINEFYSRKQQDKGRRHFYISDAGKCQRSIFFKFKKAPQEEMEPRMLRVFDHGDHVHQLIMSSLLSTRDIHVIASEVNIPPQELISGRADAVLSDGDKLYVLDVKSINSMAFRKLKAPKETHINQIQLYLHYLDPEDGILLYVSKDDQKLKEFKVKYDPQRAGSLLSSLRDLKDKIGDDIVPSRLPDYPRNWQCRYCSFKEICKIGETSEMSWKQLKENIKSNGQLRLGQKS